MRSRLIKPFVFIFFQITTFANIAFAQSLTDSLSFGSFISYVLKNHPVAKQANTLPDVAKAQIRFTRGNFDPTINTETNSKQYDAKNYYRYWDSWLKVPVWLGPDIKAGFERNTGFFLSDETATPSEGLIYAGISWPVGRSLWMDERRAALKQALQMADMNEAEKVSTINKLILEAAKDFWNWEMAYYRYRQLTIAQELAEVRFTAVKQRVIGGDEAAIDSVEAKIFLLDRKNLKLQAFVDFQNSIIRLGNYLWSDEQRPLNLDTTIVPAFNRFINRNVNAAAMQTLIEEAKRNHPKLVALNTKINIFEIEQQLLRNNLLPALRIDYNFINTPAEFNMNSVTETAFRNNYKFGMSLYYPLLLRKERGKLQMNTLKIYQTKQDLTQTERDIINNIESTFNEYLTYSSQLIIQQEQVELTNLLLNGERDKFFNGESTLFLVNTREVTMINAELKQIDLRNKVSKTLSELYWSAGQSLLE